MTPCTLLGCELLKRILSYSFLDPAHSRGSRLSNVRCGNGGFVLCEALWNLWWREDKIVAFLSPPPTLDVHPHRFSMGCGYFLRSIQLHHIQSYATFSQRNGSLLRKAAERCDYSRVPGTEPDTEKVRSNYPWSGRNHNSPELSCPSLFGTRSTVL